MSNKKATNNVTIAKAKGRPMLTWVGKKPLGRVTAYPAQTIERFDAAPAEFHSAADWSNWPRDIPQGGLLYHGDNKDVLAHLLANGFRGKVKLIYIDPPFDSGADYVRKVQLRGAKGTVKIDGEDYTLGEQIQYSDIWANDSYLQFMYERLLMLKEFLAEDGSIFLHCDERQSHRIRCVLDEVFGESHFKNEIIWYYSNKYGANSQTFDVFHNSILWYGQSKLVDFHSIEVPVKEKRLQPVRRWNKETNKNEWLRDADGNYLYQESSTKSLGDVWEVPVINPMALERCDYPTQKPEALLKWVVNCSTSPGDLVMDCFMGSGTTAAVAQKLGRRWIGCDINKGAIQTTAKRLQTLMREQAAAANKQQGSLLADEGESPAPCQLAFTTWRVNDYDLQIQHNEAVELACQHLGITRTRTDSYFDGTQGSRLVKILPFNHPLTPLDLEALNNELKARPSEERDILLVSLGVQHDARQWLEQYNKNRPVNKIHHIELRTDRKFGGFIKHEPLSAEIDVKRDGDKLIVDIQDVISPTIIQRLNMESGVFRAQIDDWRAVVDCVLIDTAHDGAVFNVALSDMPSRKQDLVQGRYALPAPTGNARVAVKIIDMLGEELIATFEV